MKNFKQLLVGAVAVLASALSVQATDRFVIDFETTDYGSVSTYDWWEASPFRVQKGQTSSLLNPTNYARVVDNPYAEADAQTGIAANGSGKVLAFQRSRQGSNMFGARIDLTEAQRFELTSTTQYVHVMMHKPVEGRAMLIGLGRHNSSTANYSEMWADQPNDVVQFTILGNNKPSQGAWSDVVFPIKGAGKIDIYSLVVVVDCEAPHTLSDDFVAYIDKVTLNDVSTPAISLAGNYPISFDPTTVSRSDRYLNSVSITTGGQTYVKAVENRMSYTKAFDSFVYATAGSTVTVQGDYHGDYMHSFVYFDKDNNGKFDLNADLVGSNTASSNGYAASHTFTIPSNCAPGVYRLRFKVDWSDTEPAGSMVEGNDIIRNGGCILDALFYISSAEGIVSVSNDQRNGEIVQADGTSFSNYTHPLGTPLTVKARPESGFSYAGMTLTYGVVDGEEEVNDNPQYLTKYISYKKFSDDDTYTIPARYLKSDLVITGDMVETANFHPATATFPYRSSEPSEGKWAAGTKAYYVKNYSNNYYVTTSTVDDSQNLKLTDTTVPTTGAGQWVVCGDDEDGYRFYNVAAGPSKVLGMTGSEGNARMKLYTLDAEEDEVTASGVTTRFFPTANGSKGYAFRMAEGSNNCLNFRDSYLALWDNASSPSNNGSTFVFSDPTELEDPEEPEEPEVDPATLSYRKGTQITAQSTLQNGDLILLPYYYKDGAGILKYTGSQSGNLLNRQNYGPDKTATEPYAAQYVWEVVNVNTSTNPATFQLRNLSNKDAYLPTGFKRNDTYSGAAAANIYMQAVSGSCGDNHFALSFTNVINASNNTYHFNSDTEAVGFFGYSATVNSSSSQISFAIYKAVAETETPDDDDDEPTVCTIDKTNGDLYRGGSLNNTQFASVWKSKDASLTFSTGANNMQWNGTNIDARTGGSSSTYTLTCTSPDKRITNVTVTLKSLSTSDQTWVIDGTSYTINQTARTVTLEDISAQSITMVNTGANNGTLLTDFNVTLSDYDPYAELLSESFAKAKWLQITNASNTSYAMTTKSGDTGGSNLHTALCNAGEEGQLFAFVGDNTNGFVIYNKALGSTYSLKTTGTGNGTAATWTTDTPQKWYLDDSHVSDQNKPGYVITPNVSSNMGLNMYGGAGGDAKFYGAGDGGTHWLLSPVSSTPTIIHYVVSGTKAHQDANNYVGLLNVTKGSYNSNAYITPDYNGRTENLYLPKGGQTINVANTKLHGWSCAVSQTGGEYTVTYTAENTDYQYLAFNETAQWYRIPAIAKAYNGDLVAIYDYRVCHNDVGFGEVDQVMRRSTDGGLTWSEETKIADGNGGGNHFGAAYGDPALVADRESGKMTLITVSGQQAYPSATATSHPMVAALYSTDNGQTWSTPVDITSQFWGAKGAMFQDEDTEAEAQANGSQFAYSGFFGSGKILQSRKVKVGTSYRLYAAMLCRGRNISGAYVVYSDDFGHTWNLLGGDNAIKACSGSDEPKVEELPNGDIVLSGRKSYGRYFNIWSWATQPTAQSPAGVGSWGTDLQSNQQTGGISVGANSCNGEILLVEATKAFTGQPATLMLQSLPAGSGRSDVEIWYKDITDASTYATTQTFAQNWTKGLRVSTTSSAYSTMTLQADGNIGFFYEEGPATYCMVYVPLSISKITSNAYTGSEAPTDPCEELQTKINEVMEHLYNEEVGYPDIYADANQTAIGNLFDYVISEQVSETNYEAAKAAYEAVVALTDVNKPVPGKAYTIAFRKTDGTKKWYVKGNTVTENAAEATVFIAGTSNDTSHPYIFTTNDGTYLHYQGTTAATAYVASQCDFSCQPMVGASGTNVTATKEQRFGTVYMIAAQRGSGSYPTKAGDLILKEADLKWDNADGAFMNNNFTTALEIKEVTYAYNHPALVKGDDGYYASIYLPFAMQVPDGVECYRGTTDNGDNLALALMNDNNAPVPAGAYVLYSNQTYKDEETGSDLDRTEVSVVPAAAAPTAVENIFTGSTADGDADQMWRTYLEGHNPYVLANKSKGIGFYKYIGTTYPKGKAIYLAGTTGNVNGYTFTFNDIVEAIEQARTSETSSFKEGREALLFDLTGRRQGKAVKGVSITGGKKIIK